MKEIKVEIVTLQVKKNKTLRLKLPVDKISFPQDAKEVIVKYIGKCDREHLIVLTLDTGNQINYIQTVSIGTLNSAPAHPREIFKLAVKTNAASIILGHNHPSGRVYPSKEDIAMTQKMVEAGKILGIEVLDHIIVSDKEYTSLKEQGYI